MSEQRDFSQFNMATVNADNTDSQLNEAISSLNSKRIDMKKEQDLAIKSLLKEKDVLAVLPTGFGKSLMFQVFAVCFPCRAGRRQRSGQEDDDEKLEVAL